MAAMMLAMVLTVCAAAPAGSFAFASGADAQSKAAEEAVTEESREPEPGEAEVPDLAEGEMPELTTDNPVTFRLTSEAVMMAASLKTTAAGASSGKDSMKEWKFIMM